MKTVAAILFAAGLILQSVTAQTPQKPESQIAPEDIIRITTSLVQTDVVIVDKDDHVIPDIKLDEIKVSDNGKRQDVKFIEFVAPGATPRVEGNLSIAGNPATGDYNQRRDRGRKYRSFSRLDQCGKRESGWLE